MWALATEGKASPEPFDAIAEVAPARLKKVNSQDLAITVLAFSTSCHASPVAFDAISEVATERLKDFHSEAFAGTGGLLPRSAMHCQRF